MAIALATFLTSSATAAAAAGTAAVATKGIALTAGLSAVSSVFSGVVENENSKEQAKYQSFEAQRELVSGQEAAAAAIKAGNRSAAANIVAGASAGGAGGGSLSVSTFGSLAEGKRQGAKALLDARSRHAAGKSQAQQTRRSGRMKLVKSLFGAGDTIAKSMERGKVRG